MACLLAGTHVPWCRAQNPDNTVQIANKHNTNTLSFMCPPEGKVRCQANLNNDDDGPSYSLRGARSLFSA
ncbi:hypothetical protein BD413DRAFT_243752 [Trametes elegans]|nr:hypothetical protein BD413DRAFT_243752 [Trametes elegans]